MTHKLWQKKPKLNYSKNILDIIQFGSSETEDTTPNDIDIAIIFKEIPLKNQLTESQKIKKQLQKNLTLPIHTTSFTLQSLFDASNFARENILFHGKSLISKKPFAKSLGLTPKIQIYYSLQNLKKKEKIKFNYLLNGKKEKYGLLRKYGGSLLKPGLIEIYPEHEKIFTEAIKKITLNFELKKTLILAK